MKLERMLNAFFTAARGAFCGLAGGVIIINFALDKDRQLLDHYGRTSNLFRTVGLSPRYDRLRRCTQCVAQRPS